MDDMAGLFVQIVIMAAFGCTCAAIASNRGRSVVGWFFIGFFFSCIGLVVVLALPDLRQQELERRRQRDENRRLRERIAKDRVVADERHQGLTQRLVAHDQALGLDTSGAPRLLEGTPTASTELLPPPLPEDALQWYFARAGQRYGPVSTQTVRKVAMETVGGEELLVWRAGMAQWQPFDSVSEFGGTL